MFRLDGKTAVITGAGSGIGRAIAQAFAKQGARVIAADINLEAVEGTAALGEPGARAITPRQLDVSNAESVQAFMHNTIEQFETIDILVNNAGVGHIGTVQSTKEADFDRLFQINVKGVFLCTQAVIEHMVGRGKGCILNMASIASLIGVKDRFAYSMTKGAVLTMTYSTAVDYVSKGIRCNCICPSRVHTPFVDGFLKRDYPGREQEMFEQLSRYQPIGRMCTPDEVAALAVYLCADESSFITGIAHPIDGGVLVH